MKRAAITLIVVLAFGLTACKPEIHAHPIIVGDSLSFNASKQIYENLSLVSVNDPHNRYLFTPDWVGGVGVRVIPGVSDPRAWWITHLATVVDHVNPEAWVIELGTNDCRTNNGDQYGSAIDLIMSNVPSAKPVVWMTLTIQDPQFATCKAAVNEAIAAAPNRWPNLTAFDLGAWMNDPKYFGTDGVHYTDAGNFQYARAVRAAVEGVLP